MIGSDTERGPNLRMDSTEAERRSREMAEGVRGKTECGCKWFCGENTDETGRRCRLTKARDPSAEFRAALRLQSALSGHGMSITVDVAFAVAEEIAR